jgi:hypothetical protein
MTVLIQKINSFGVCEELQKKILMWKNNTSESNKRNNAIFKQDVAKLPRRFAVDN